MTVAAFEPRDAEVRRQIREDVESNMCVEAGAGTGKTSVLVDRIVQILRTTATRADELAVITFTEKAAAELASRVRRGLEDALPDAAGIERERIEAALRDLNRAHIETIHAFAASLLRERPVEAHLDPGFDVLDELRERLAFDAAWSDWIGDQAALQPPPAALLGALNAGLDFKYVRIAADRLNSNRDALPLAAYDEEVVDLPALLDEIRTHYDELRALDAQMIDDTDKTYVVIPDYLDLCDGLLALHGDAEALIHVVVTADLPKYGRGAQRNWRRPGDCRDAKALLQAISDGVLDRRFAIRRNATGRLVFWLREFVAFYDARRKAEGGADFDDLLIWARDLVRDREEVRAYFASKYRSILVDEFQDTDPLQAELIVRLCSDGPVPPNWHEAHLRPGSLFVVGDPKQSIYRFRRADISMYDDVKRRVFGGTPRTIVQNFRSAKPIIDWVNATFERMIDEEPGVQPAYIALEPRPDFPGMPDAVSVVENAPMPSGTSAGNVRTAESTAIAALLAREIEAGAWRVREGEAERPASWRDVAVLVSNRTEIRYYEEALARAGVPYRHEGGRTFFARQEVRELVAVLRAIDDPADGVAAVAALRSSAFGCSDEELLLYRDGARFDHGSVPPDATDNVAAALRDLHELADSRHETPLPELVRMVLDRTRLVEFAMLQPQGDQIAANLLKIIDQARAFTDAGGGGLRSFVRWLRENVTRASDPAAGAAPESEASISEETDDVVRMLTVHASKGLEFPIVVFANMDTQRNQATNVIVCRNGSAPAFHARLGNKLEGFQTPGYEAAELGERRYREAEEHRLLYVAATRAKDRLIVPLCSPPPKAGPDVNSLNGWLRLARADDGATRIDAGALPPIAAEPSVWRRPLEAADPAAVRGVIETREGWLAGHQQQVDLASAGLLVRTATSLKEGTEPPSASDDTVRRGRAADFGSAVHALLERIDLARPDDALPLAIAIADECGQIGRGPEIGAVARRALASDAVARAMRSRRLLREVAFTAPLPDELGLAEGRIDLLFEEDGGIVIVDFKTDDVAGASLEARVVEYRTQALVYAWASREATRLPVREVIFLFARPGVERSIPVDAGFRAEAEALMRMPAPAGAA